MVKNIKNSGSGSSKNIRNDDSLKLSTLKVIDATITNATITNLTNTELQTATSDIIDLENNKQDIITDSTDIELSQLEVNDKLKFQFGTTDDEKTLIERGDATGKLKFTANNVFFHDDTDTEVFAIKNNGDLNCFNNSIDNVADIDFNGSSLITQLTAKQDTLTAGNGIDIVGTTISVDEAELTTKQDTLTAGNGIDIVGTTISVDEAELTTKQDTLTAGNGIDIVGSTISVDEAELTTKQDTLEAGDQITMGNLTIDQPGATNVTMSMKNSTTSDLFRIVYNTDSNSVFIQKSDDGAGTVTYIRMRTEDIRFNVDFDLNDNDILNGGDGAFSTITLSGSDLQGKLDDKQDNIAFAMPLESVGGLIRLNYNSTEFTVNASDELELTGTLTSNLNLNNNNLLNGGSGSFSSISLNGNDVEDAINDKADDFAINSNGLLMDSGAFPIRELRLLYDTTYFNINGSNELSLNKHINVCKTTNFNLSSSGNWGSTTTTYPYISGWGTIDTPSGATFLSNASNGIFSVNSNGLYKIVISIAGENVAVNNRVILAVYLSIDDADTAFRTVPAEFLLAYLRDDNFAVGGSSEFTVYKTLTTSNTVRLKTRLGTGSDNRNYNDQTDDANLNIYSSFIIEKID